MNKKPSFIFSYTVIHYIKINMPPLQGSSAFRLPVSNVSIWFVVFFIPLCCIMYFSVCVLLLLFFQSCLHFKVLKTFCPFRDSYCISFMVWKLQRIVLCFCNFTQSLGKHHMVLFCISIRRIILHPSGVNFLDHFIFSGANVEIVKDAFNGHLHKVLFLSFGSFYIVMYMFYVMLKCPISFYSVIYRGTRWIWSNIWHHKWQTGTCICMLFFFLLFIAGGLIKQY